MQFFFIFTDEIMHQDIIPLYAADIQDQLKKQFAYLSGKTMVLSHILCLDAWFSLLSFHSLWGLLHEKSMSNSKRRLPRPVS